MLAERAPLPTVIVAFVLGGALGAYGLANISTSFSATDFVPDDSPLLETFTTLQEDFGGGVGETTSIVEVGDVATPAAHNALVASLASLAEVEGVATVQGRAAAQSPISVLAGLVTPGADGAPPANPELAQSAFADGLQEDLTVSDDFDVAALYAGMVRAAPEVMSVVAAMLLLVLVYGVERRRPFLGVVTIAPVALIVLWTFATMAATGIPFGPVTATIAALAVGIGVPYTIHVTQRFLEDRRTEGEGAIRATVRHTGGSLISSAFTTIAGFGVLVTSSLTPFRQFGLVTVYAIGFALIAAVLVLPSLLVLWDRWHRRHGEEPTPVSGGSSAEREPAGV